MLVPPRLESWNGIKYSRTPGAGNRSVICYVAPAGGAWIKSIAQAGGVDAIVRTFPAGDATLNAINPLGTVEDEFQPWGPPLRGRIVRGESVLAAFGDGMTIDGAGLSPFTACPFPLEEGRVLSISTPAVVQVLNCSFQIMEFPPEGTA